MFVSWSIKIIAIVVFHQVNSFMRGQLNKQD